MPMPDKNFNWRPNDKSSLTNHRYDLEAEKWYHAFKSAQRKNFPTPSFGSILGKIGPILMIPMLLFLWIFVIVLLIFRAFGIILPILPGDKLEIDRMKNKSNKLFNGIPLDIPAEKKPIPMEMIEFFKGKEGDDKKMMELYKKSAYGTY